MRPTPASATDQAAVDGQTDDADAAASSGRVPADVASGENEGGLARGLHNRHLQLIAIGGDIGTGLLRRILGFFYLSSRDLACVDAIDMASVF